MRILFLGDVVGPPGVKLLEKAVPMLRERESLHAVIANVENAAGGSGLTPKLYHRLRRAGVDLMTMGDHVYKKADVIPTLQLEQRICRPANYPPDAPGRDFALWTLEDGVRIAVMVVQGRTFLRPVDCPFHAADRVLESLREQADLVFVDVHAEATAEKYQLGHHLKGRVTAVLGTHTHVPTADEQVLAGGTAFVCDVGMCGPYDSILGRRIDRVLPTSIDFVPRSFDVATGDVRLSGAVIEADAATGKATSIRRFTFFEDELAPA